MVYLLTVHVEACHGETGNFHQQCLRICGGFFICLRLVKPDGHAATVMCFLFLSLHSALLSTYRVGGGLTGRVGGSASIDLFISCHCQGVKMLQQLYCICQPISTLAPHVRT